MIPVRLKHEVGAKLLSPVKTKVFLDIQGSSILSLKMMLLQNVDSFRLGRRKSGIFKSRNLDLRF